MYAAVACTVTPDNGGSRAERQTAFRQTEVERDDFTDGQNHRRSDARPGGADVFQYRVGQFFFIAMPQQGRKHGNIGGVTERSARRLGRDDGIVRLKRKRHKWTIGNTAWSFSFATERMPESSTHERFSSGKDFITVANQTNGLYQHCSGDPFSGALVRLRHAGSVLRLLGGFMGNEARVRAALHQLCGSLTARVVFVSSAGARLLSRGCGLAGAVQLSVCRIDCRLDRICGECDRGLGLAAERDRRGALCYGGFGHSVWNRERGSASRFARGGHAGQFAATVARPQGRAGQRFASGTHPELRLCQPRGAASGGVAARYRFY